ncbi:MAG: FAD-dependent oxidoreductase [Patescibacteria group bacterium]|nr:FAD-dependent oxidoreductase [Patescibacteria group bacterium]
MEPQVQRTASRRAFFKAGAVAAAGWTIGATDARSEEVAPGQIDGEAYMEPGRQVPIVAKADVVVCGGGPAGVAAAIAAARAGAKTCLLEANGCIGGIWTGGLLSYLLDYHNKPGVMQEIIARLKEREQARRAPNMVDPEAMKLVLEQMCLESGVDIQLHTQCAAAVRDASNRLALVVTESKSGREAVAGKVFIDCTGEGDVAHQAGCQWDYGRPEVGDAQPMSFIVLLAGIHLDEVRPYVSSMPGDTWAAPKDALAEIIRQSSGFGPSYAKPSLFPIRETLFCLMANHEYGFRGFDTRELTKATLQGRAELHRMIDGLRSLGGPWKDVRICSSPERIGVRESRRIHGRYTVSSADIAGGTAFADAVCRCTFPVDVHSTTTEGGKGIERAPVRAKPFDIPYRSLVAKDVDGLMMAGRCISGDFYAHSAYRVTGNSVAMGQAAGFAAAAAVKDNVLPHDIDWAELGKSAPWTQA